MMKFRKITVFAVIFLLLSNLLFKYQDTKVSALPYQLVYITSAEDLIQLADSCRMDSYSVDKMVILKNDIDVSGYDIKPIPVFSGIFDGDGHILSGVSLDTYGSNMGLFRYVEEGAVIRNLDIEINHTSNGSRNNIAGIAGTNKGIIMNCSAEGWIDGEKGVGGIAGINLESGIIVECTNFSNINGSEKTGGIAGINYGKIGGCENQGVINDEENDMSYDIGGICGISYGTVLDSSNYGEIGHIHMGYNVGGICGRQCGLLSECINEGIIYGRKDVGGICGHFETYTTIYYEEDELQAAIRELNEMIDKVENIIDRLETMSEEAKTYAEELKAAIDAYLEEIGESIDTAEVNLNDIYEKTDEFQVDMDELMTKISDEDFITDAYSDIEAYINDDIADDDSDADNDTDEDSDTDNDTDDNTDDNMEGNPVNIVRSGTTMVDDDWDDDVEDEDEEDEDLEDEDLEDEDEEDIDLEESVLVDDEQDMEEEFDYTAECIKKYGFDTNNDSDDEDEEDEDDEDIDEDDEENNSDEKVSIIRYCHNNGQVNANSNAGGIAGIISVEISSDKDQDISFSGERLSLNVSADVQADIMACINTGEITASNKCSGGIAGRADLGTINSCHSKAIIKNEGSYTGGITGQSFITVSNCLSVCSITGKDYSGGIAGSADTLISCISVCNIESDGEQIGAVSGEITGEVINCYFINEEIGGVDGIDYDRKAIPVNAEDIAGNEQIPEIYENMDNAWTIEEDGCHLLEAAALKSSNALFIGSYLADLAAETSDFEMKVNFFDGGTLVGTVVTDYDGSIDESDIPDVPEHPGQYGEWEEFDADSIKMDMNIYAVYTDWHAAISTNEDKPLFLVEGLFDKTATLTAEEIDRNNVIFKTGYRYSAGYELIIDDVSTNANNMIKVRYLTDIDDEHLLIADLNGRNIEYERDGSYAVFTLESDRTVVFYEKTQDNTQNIYLLIFAGGLIICVTLLTIIIRKIKKRLTRKKQSTIIE